MNDRAATIRDVAADAGVGTATVSRVLNEPWKVRPETTERVKASVERLGYKPNFRARLLARGNCGTVCFLMSNRPFVHSVHGSILNAAAHEADILEVQVVYASCYYSPDTPPSAIQLPQLLRTRGLIDGVIAAGANSPNLLEAISALDLPCVVFGTNLITGSPDRIPNAVYVDDEQGGRLAAGHLIELGHKRIRFVGDVTLPWFRNRYEGFRKAMEEASLECLPPVGKMGEESIEMGAAAVAELMDGGSQFTALFVGSDRVAFGAVQALRRRGVRVPEDVSVVGFDDDDIAPLVEPPLTTVRMSSDEIGAQCMLMLNDLVRGAGGPHEPVVVPLELIVRESTAAR